ncbi:MAG: RNA pseudouridine synthase, partial [Eubacteriales bacterium]|nr:RNA pseudouridine synthase [Eubacteriales bacterium]
FAGKEKSNKAAELTREAKTLRKEVKVLYHDEDIVILHKPAGMLSQKSEKTDDSLNDYLQDLCRKNHWVEEASLEFFRPSVANRLDRNTSGIVLCGITTKGLQTLSKTLKDRTISKYYYALVAGQVKEGRHLKGYLRKDTEKNVVHFSEKASEDAVAIETEYQVVRSCKEASLLKIRLITGKSHQIRAHLASEGYPIIGDYKYGDRRINQRVKKDVGVSYQMLHSCEIDFGKYFGGRVIRDSIPRDFARTMDYFGLEL